MVNATTINDWDGALTTVLSRKLLVGTLKEMGMEDNAKEFSKKSNRVELKSFVRRITGGVIFIVKMILIIILIMIVIGIISVI